MSRPIVLLALVAFAQGALSQPVTPAVGIVQAAQSTLDANPQLGVQRQQVLANQGAIQIQQGAFDLKLNGGLNAGRKYTPLLPAGQAGYGVESLQADTVSSELGATQQFRSGIVLMPQVQMSRSQDNYSQPVPVSQPQVSLQVVLPLLRNSGREAVAAKESAAVLEEQASAQDLVQLASQLLGATATAYWQYVGSTLTLGVQRDAEERARQMLESVQALASVDIVPRVQVQDALGNLGARAASRIGQEQAVVQARQQLGLAMGLDATGVLDVGSPVDPLPEGNAVTTVPLGAADLRRLVDAALANRTDLRAARLRVDAQRSLLAASRNQLKPQLDAVATVGYTGIRERGAFASPLWQSPVGPNVSLGLRYQFPVANLEAQGAAVQAEAAVRQADLRAGDIERQIASSVVTAATALNLTVAQLAQSRSASTAAKAALDGAKARLSLGVGSVMDALQAEDRYLSALTNEISVQVAHAVAIANFRTAAGTWLDPAQPVQWVGRPAFYTLSRP